MKKMITIAVDAMGGDNSPKKTIEGCEIFLNNNSNVKLVIFGNKKSINNNYATIIRDEKWLHWRLMECPYKRDIYFFEYKNNFAIVHIFFKNVKRLNILYTYSTDISYENELYCHITNWAINNDIDVLWAINLSLIHI